MKKLRAEIKKIWYNIKNISGNKNLLSFSCGTQDKNTKCLILITFFLGYLAVLSQ